MNISMQHDGFGNFVPVNMPECSTPNESGMRLMLSSVIEGVGKTILEIAAKRRRFLGKFLVSAEGDADMSVFGDRGLSLVIKTDGSCVDMEEMAKEAIAHCFPADLSVCKVTCSVTTNVRS